MPRSNIFHPSHEPLCASSSLDRQEHQTSGPFSFLNPTRARYIHSPPPPSFPPSSSSSSPNTHTPQDDHHPASGLGFQWRSRDNRKGRHALLVESSTSKSTAYSTPGRTSSAKATLRGISAMFTTYPYWDVSYLVAVIFSLGSVIWVINAFFVFLPLVQPRTEFEGEASVAGGWTAFIGATVFELGSVLLMLEAVNENRTGCFGWAIEKVEEEGLGLLVRREGKDGCGHHHANKGNFVGKGVKTSTEKNMGHNEVDGEQDVGKYGENGPKEKSWQWWPSWHDLTTHYIFELGFLACSAQMFGATVFWISGFTALPYIYDKFPSQGAIDGGYWVPQIVGGSGFITSGLLFMLETQDKWYRPAFKVLGWHIGLWNLIGALGFTLCGALGPAYANSGAQFEASLATFWGSWAFLIGSLIQWYESLDTHPVEETEGIGGKTKGMEKVEQRGGKAA